MLSIVYTNKMKRDIKRMQKRGKSMAKLDTVLRILVSRQPLPVQYHDHQLTGDLCDFRECHIEPDWLLIYRIYKNELILSLSGTGTHSDLFHE